MNMAVDTSVDPPVHVHMAESADVPAIARMSKELACEEGCPEVVQATLQDWQRDLFGPQPHFTATLADRRGEVAGMLIYGKEHYPGWAASVIKIHDLYVRPEHRRQHVARALLEHVAGFALQNGIILMHLNVRKANPARLFYSRAGFQQVPECLTYLIALPGIAKLAQAATELAEVDLPEFL